MAASQCDKERLRQIKIGNPAWWTLEKAYHQFNFRLFDAIKTLGSYWRPEVLCDWPWRRLVTLGASHCVESFLTQMDFERSAKDVDICRELAIFFERVGDESWLG